MIDHDHIAPPPSLADILSGGEDLIGRVDFGSRLVPEAGAEAPAPAPARSRTPRVAAKPVAPEPTPAEAKAEPTPVAEETPAPAKPRASRPKARTTAKATLRPTLKRVVPPVAEEEPEASVEAETEPEEYDDLDEPGSFNEEPTPYDEQWAAPFVDPLAGRTTARRELPMLTAPSVLPDEDVAYLGLSVEDVADSARARMRTAEVAHLRHLEAIENEAARRLELLTAQAELDAELIRLHARREAHAIITAARTRTGEVSGPSRAERRLADVGGSFSRFADTLESSLAPDHRYRP